MDDILSEGECLYCNEKFPQASIFRHLQKHLAEKSKENKPGKSFLLKVGTNPKWSKSLYFLALWIDGDALIDDIDYFLRGIWLECCGHMSAFTNPKNKHKGGGWNFMESQELLMKNKIDEYEKMMEDENGEIAKFRKAKEVLSKGMKIDYEYDFGSTTDLQLAILQEYPVKADKEIVLLSRNEPLEIRCDLCKKEPAEVLCMACAYDDESYFCKKCAKKHAKTCDDFDDYSSMPVVNSPRVGVCGYTGGRIDKKRDGVWKK
ncbi:MAG TPA: hypothetical protein VFI29_12490 [Hanamia sp.]|nr:hypothetical protein [Hanamia sp.]